MKRPAHATSNARFNREAAKTNQFGTLTLFQIFDNFGFSLEVLCKRLTRREGLPLVPVSFLCASSLLVMVLLISILLTVPTRRLRAAESSAQGEDCEEKCSGEDGVVEEEGGVEGDVVGAAARENRPCVALLLRLLHPIDVYGGGGYKAKQGEDKEESEETGHDCVRGVKERLSWLIVGGKRQREAGTRTETWSPEHRENRPAEVSTRDEVIIRYFLRLRRINSPHIINHKLPTIQVTSNKIPELPVVVYFLLHFLKI